MVALGAGFLQPVKGFLHDLWISILKEEGMTIRDTLKKVEAFQKLTDDELAAIEAFCTEKTFSKGHRLFKEEEKAEHLHVVADGLIDLRFELPARETSEEHTLSSISENRLIGWSSLIPPHRYKLSAYCVSKTCRVIEIDRKRLLSYLSDHPEIGYRVLSVMLKVVGERFQNLQASADVAPFSGAKIVVHLSTCGIAAGAREVMTALTKEAMQCGRHDIQILAGSCMGRCSTEPNVTIEVHGENPVVYHHMDAEKMRRVFQKHVLDGVVQTDCVLDERSLS